MQQFTADEKKNSSITGMQNNKSELFKKSWHSVSMHKLKGWNSNYNPDKLIKLQPSNFLTSNWHHSKI